MLLFAKSRETGVEYGKILQIVIEPFTAEELRWNALQAVLILALVLLASLLVLIVLLIWWLIQNTRGQAQALLSDAAAKEASRSERLGIC